MNMFFAKTTKLATLQQNCTCKDKVSIPFVNKVPTKTKMCLRKKCGCEIQKQACEKQNSAFEHLTCAC